jgi:IS5 family transposase
MTMQQQTLAVAADQGSGYEQYRKPTRHDEFLAAMQAIVPWAALCDSASLRQTANGAT